MKPFVWRNPSEITDEVRAFAKTLVPDSAPLLIPIEPPAFALLYDCYRNSERCARHFGGMMVLGWDVCEDADQLIFQATFHAAWQNSLGELIDVTPNEDGFIKTLFVPDRLVEFPEGDVLNRFQARLEDPVLQKAIRILAWEDSLWASTHIEHTSRAIFSRTQQRRRERRWREIMPEIEELRRKKREGQ